MASPTSCSGVYRPFRTLQHAWSLAPVGVTTSPLSCSNYTGYQYDSEWNLSSLSWSTRRLTIRHHRNLSGDCQLVATTGRRQLRSSDNFKCTVITTSSRLGDRAFELPVNGTRITQHFEKVLTACWKQTGHEIFAQTMGQLRK